MAAEFGSGVGIRISILACGGQTFFSRSLSSSLKLLRHVSIRPSCCMRLSSRLRALRSQFRYSASPARVSGVVKVSLPARWASSSSHRLMRARRLFADQQLHPAVQRKIFIADGQHKVLHQLQMGAVQLGTGADDLLVWQVQGKAAGGGHDRNRTLLAGTGKHIPEQAARPHVGNGNAGPVRRAFYGGNATFQQNADLPRFVPGQQQNFVPRIAPHTGGQSSPAGCPVRPDACRAAAACGPIAGNTGADPCGAAFLFLGWQVCRNSLLPRQPTR